ncbi:unnamed protein product [Clavelina lepadiformis]|uniref:Carboxylic ester hydrolase n=1 Tax=Clavelina lepadiformis TaxID=159417 RepID=A0ABP0GKV0_CLALP
MGTSNKVVSLVNYGKVRSGLISQASHPRAKPVFHYIEIPFAQPPVEKLRFLPPEKALPWNGVLCNTKQTKIPMQIMEGVDVYSKFCPQKRSFFIDQCSEDCLYLNLFVPDVQNSTKIPVMVWFYGGAFQIGPSSYFDGTALAGMNDVIVVVPNYRVNTFGFISMEDGTGCNGNLGLLDQLAALKWVRENIGSFGGDKDNVTIFGESAGGISVNMHMMSPLSQGYFHKAVSFSGTAVVPRAFIKDQTRAYKKFLEILDVKEILPKKILEKLQSFSTQQIYDANLELQLVHGYTWYPTVDGNFLVDTPATLLSDGRFLKMPYMLGCNNSEGGWVMNSAISNYLSGLTEKEYKFYASIFLKWYNRSIDSKKALPILLKQYNKGSNLKDKMYYSKGVAGVMADATFVTSIIHVADKHAEFGASTYFYHMTHQPRHSHHDDYGPKEGRKPSYVGADHVDDVFFNWGLPFLPDSINDGFHFSQDEADLSRLMMTYITNFAKTGNPNVGDPHEFEWPAYNSRSRPHLVLDIPLSKGIDFGVENYNLYTKVLPNL